MSSNSFRDSVTGRSLQGLGLLSSLHNASCLPQKAGSFFPCRCYMWAELVHSRG